MGNDQLKPATECCKAMVTYLDMVQGCYSMALTDLGNWSAPIGDLIEMLLGFFSFVSKERMLDWSWLGISELERSPQRPNWEMYRAEHLSHARGLDVTFQMWLEYPRFCGYAVHGSGSACMCHRCDFSPFLELGFSCVLSQAQGKWRQGRRRLLDKETKQG